MALYNLSSTEMVGVTDAWRSPENPARAVFLAHPELNAKTPYLEQATDALRAPAPASNDPAVAALVAAAGEADAQHDTFIRGVDLLLQGASVLGGTRVMEGKRITEIANGVKTAILPEGLREMQRTYRAEAAAAASLRQRLATDTTLREQLQGIVVFGVPLLVFVEAWIADGHRLGQLEDRRDALLLAPGGGDRVKLARNAWMRAVKSIEADVDLLQLGDAEREALLLPLRRAEATADARGTSGEVTGTVPTATPTEGTPG